MGGGGTSRSAPLLFMYLFVTNYVQKKYCISSLLQSIKGRLAKKEVDVFIK